MPGGQNQTAWLHIDKWQGKPRIAVVFGEATETDRKRKVRRVEISAGDAALPLNLLERLYKDQIAGIDAPAKPVRTAAQQKALDAIIGIIETSHHEGEREAAREAYKKVTGASYVARPA